ncbi:MAG: hypothetical protein CVT84_14275, partial [Alphaproteobacteria bacterium HGW-Alphaproteobacteria-6]
AATAAAGGREAFLAAHAPQWQQVGRVCFHLAENKSDATLPFAFLATIVFAGLHGRVRRIEAICARHGTRLVDAALRFPLCHPAVVSVIPGGQGAAEMAANLAAAQAAVPPALWAELKAEGLMRADAPVGAKP